ncbi:MAG: hypothetical protein O3A84_00640, partial [Proteobacteria bacterium]|nr:hypothetical protein [Pseudomonadota bacterium]
MFKLFAVALAASTILLTAALSHTDARAAEKFEFDLHVDAGAQRFQEEMEEGRRRVREWWGATFEGTITVEARPEYRISKALVPAWRGNRGRMEFGPFPIARGFAATIHELVHVYAPNGNRFLAEGLAVYAHDHLKGPDAFPNNGRNLKSLAKDLVGKFTIAELDSLATPARMPGKQGGRESYILAGSFVKFLIETYSLEKFRGLYALSPLIVKQRIGGAPERYQ